MIIARSLKKGFTILLTLVYLQVNVAWAGVPSLSLFSLPKLKIKDVIVFQADYAKTWRQPDIPKPPKTDPEETKPKVAEKLRHGKHEDKKKVETPKVETKQRLDVLEKNVKGASTISAAAGEVTKHLI